jgi:hypothetical protein
LDARPRRELLIERSWFYHQCVVAGVARVNSAVMRFLSRIVVLALMALSLSVFSLAVLADSVRKFDEWHDLPFTDEKARLDNVAIQWHNEPSSIVYLVVYAGRVACVAEANARGTRAKNYLVRQRRVKPASVVVVDGGYKESVVTEIWFLPRKLRGGWYSSEVTLERRDVTLDRTCRIKCRACQ